MKTITIIGGGASGALILINILKYHSDAPIAVKWIEKSGEFGIGTAYSTDKDYHLLNVPANLMGIYHDYANDFFEWLLKKGYSYSEHDYVPRKIYGDYIKDNLFSYLKKNTSVSIELIHAEVTDIDIDMENDHYILTLSNQKKIFSNDIVLATGNFLPSNLRLNNMDYVNEANYFRNPWSNELNNNLKRTDDVLIIGTGLTMVDKVLDLYHQIHKGKIIALSRNGYLPFTHYPCSRHQKYNDYTAELLEAANAKDLFSIIRKHIDIGIKSGIDWRVVVDTIRPSLPAIWDRLSLKEQKRFYRHLGSLWTVVRHRIPVICADILHLLKDKKQLQVLGGRIQEITATEKGFEVTYIEKETQELKTITVNKVINCSGPQLNPLSTDSVLFKNLFAKGWLCTDQLGLGFNVLPDGRLLDKENNVLPDFYTIGNGLKGILFESTAIPEIRVQAHQLAKLLIESTIETV
ncbi:MAG: FAD/NAD(P)-binding protein [Chitinophagales bacterium]